MKNKFFVCGDEVFIKLATDDLWTVIDLSDLDLINKFNVNWYAKVVEPYECYVTAEIKTRNKRIFWHMHRIILNLPNTDHREPDHINRNSLDNRRNNLRIVTRSINNINHGLSKNNKSGVTGVFYNSKRRNYWAYIELNGKRINLGHFKLKTKAIEARSKAEDAYL